MSSPSSSSVSSDERVGSPTNENRNQRVQTYRCPAASTPVETLPIPVDDVDTDCGPYGVDDLYGQLKNNRRSRSVQVEPESQPRDAGAVAGPSGTATSLVPYVMPDRFVDEEPFYDSDGGSSGSSGSFYPVVPSPTEPEFQLRPSVRGTTGGNWYAMDYRQLELIRREYWRRLDERGQAVHPELRDIGERRMCNIRRKHPDP